LYKFLIVKQVFTIIVLIFFSITLFAQTTINGKVKDGRGRPVAGVSVSIKDSYDGGTSDSTGVYRFTTTEKGEQIITATSIAYKPFEQKIKLDSTTNLTIDIVLKEEPNELRAVVVTAGAFEASDTKRTTVLNSIDIVTTAGSQGDVTGALKTLPGTQQVGEKEGLFVRGGTGEEAKVFIDGTVVNNFFFSSTPDIATRGRFSPFLFKGTVFSTGGYSALYGQALSGALILETIDLPEQSSANIGLSALGANFSYQQLAKDSNSSWGTGYSYTNLLPYFKIVKQNPDYFISPEFHNAEANFRIKTSKTGIIKFYGYFNDNKIGLRRSDIDSTILKDAFTIKNFNVYTNLFWKERLGKKWKMSIGLSYSNNRDKFGNELQNQQNIKQNIFFEPFSLKNFSVVSIANLAQVKAVFEKRLKGLSIFRFGGEYLYSEDKTDFSNVFVNNAKNSFVDNFKAGFAEADIYITNDLAAKLGARIEHSSILKKANIVPRISLAYKVGSGQFSTAYGVFYQKPEKNFLFFNQNLQYQKATHYILNYQKVSRDYTIRGEIFYKKYQDLIKISPDTNNNGFGNAKGFELFWRDRKTLKNVDYWISYSYLDTKRDYLNYPRAIQPNFAANHTASFVIKKFITKWKTGFNGSYTFATGRPYYDIRKQNGDNKFSIADQGKTIAYNNLSLSANYLPSIGKKTKNFIVWVVSISNVLGNKQVFNYNYSYNGLRKEAINPPASRFFFVGCFMSFGVDRSQDVINSNL
jgi:vitamin B12 transporter